MRPLEPNRKLAWDLAVEFIVGSKLDGILISGRCAAPFGHF